MIFSEHITLRIAIAVLGLFGFWVAHHISLKKRSKNPFLCPIKFDCSSVVNSDYSRLLGIPLEILGMAYYGLVFIIYLFSSVYLYFSGAVPPGNLIISMIALSVFAFLFSLYLIGVQLFVLRKWCSWCLVSALISTLIFVCTYLTYDLASLAETLIK